MYYKFDSARATAMQRRGLLYWVGLIGADLDTAIFKLRNPQPFAGDSNLIEVYRRGGSGATSYIGLDCFSPVLPKTINLDDYM